MRWKPAGKNPSCFQRPIRENGMQKIASNSIIGLNRLGRDLAASGLLVMTGLVTADVLLRRLLNAPIIFADEVSGYLLVLVTLLGVGYTLQEGAHIQVTIILDRIPPQGRAVLRVFMCLSSLVYAVILLYLTGHLAWESFELKAFSPTPSQLPLFPFQVTMPLGCLFLLLQLIVETIRAVKSLSGASSWNASREG